MAAEHGISERFVCRVLGQHRSTQRKIAKTADDEAALTADIIALAIQYGRYGYHRITALLRNGGWVVNVKRVERIWRRAGLRSFPRQPLSGSASQALDPTPLAEAGRSQLPAPSAV